MGDGLEMDTDLAGQVFDVVAAAAEELAAGWRAALAMVDDGEAGIGDDRLAAAFRSGYTGAGDRARETGDTLPVRLAWDAETGHGSAGDYLTADQRSATLLGRVPQAG
jgi:hypothetical protein